MRRQEDRIFIKVLGLQSGDNNLITHIPSLIIVVIKQPAMTISTKDIESRFESLKVWQRLTQARTILKQDQLWARSVSRRVTYVRPHFRLSAWLGKGILNICYHCSGLGSLFGGWSPLSLRRFIGILYGWLILINICCIA